ncbi:MAG: SDR family NAD(P)-dependent oxidoreductase [Rhodobiaceae bacterium]|nr:SDR family NAD(P)-dependent oxidoreductase [Rhodobiaceae bacterium]MCC0056033.1 SDR family NAD(P)-dependent oxidoreductase [Rhodobiaceae bacterium]
MPLPQDARWLITGCSSGLGAALAREVLTRGYAIAATARDTATLKPIMALAPDRVQPLALDLADPQSIADAVSVATRRGPIHVLVNNAGHGYAATTEEGKEEQIRELFDVNFFGAAALIRAVLPSMRQADAGHIVNIGSIAGIRGNPGSAYYAASKFALEGLSDALADEVAAFGVGVTVVEPGPIRTDFTGRSMVVSPAIDAYSGIAGGMRERMKQLHGRQKGDPARIAVLIVDALECPEPPRRLVVGAAAMQAATQKFSDVRADIDKWRERSAATDFGE